MIICPGRFMSSDAPSTGEIYASLFAGTVDSFSLFGCFYTPKGVVFQIQLRQAIEFLGLLNVVFEEPCL